MGRYMKMDLLLKQALEVFPNFLIVDDCSKVAYLNEHFAALLGITLDRAIGKPVTQVVPNARLDIVVKTGEAEIGSSIILFDHVKNDYITAICNRLPIKQNEITIGAVGIVFPNELEWEKTGKDLQDIFPLERFGTRSFGSERFGLRPFGAEQFGTRSFEPQRFGLRPFGAEQFGTRSFEPQQFGTRSFESEQCGLQAFGAERFESETLSCQRMEMEKKAIIKALEKANYNKTKAAHFLNIDRSALYKKMKRYNLSQHEHAMDESEHVGKKSENIENESENAGKKSENIENESDHAGKKNENVENGSENAGKKSENIENESDHQGRREQFKRKRGEAY
ncbi:hypothetical protein LQZ18_15690 [Lachnospiraceae bacterium ZAX-1]